MEGGDWVSKKLKTVGRRGVENGGRILTAGGGTMSRNAEKLGATRDLPMLIGASSKGVRGGGVRGGHGVWRPGGRSRR